MPKITSCNHIAIKQADKYRKNILRIRSKNKMFHNEYIAIKIFIDYLIFFTPPFDYIDKKYKTVHSKNGGYSSIVVANLELKKGDYIIDDEDSDEDELYMYYEQ